MWPSNDLTVDTSSNPSKSPAKRKNNPSNTTPASRDSLKRLKTLQSTSPDLRPNMNKTMGVSRAGTIDLTRVSNFQPHTGAKRLVIKNLRTTSPNDREQYFKKTWDELDDALASVFSNKQPESPLEVLCRGVEAICRRGKEQADQLYRHLEKRCRTHIKDGLLPAIVRHVGSSSVETLQFVEKVWGIWKNQLVLLRSIFSYLDRSYLLNSKTLPQLEDMGIQQFREIVFVKGKDISKAGTQAILGICELVRYDREGLDSFDPVLLRASISTIHILGIYKNLFEERFQVISLAYLEQFAMERSASSLREYISSCDKLLQRESLRCDTYNFDSTTKKALLDTAHDVLISKRADVLLEPVAVSKLLEEEAMASLKSLYQLLCLSKIQKELKKPFASYIKVVGSSIAMDKERGDEMVVRLLELKRSLDIVIRDAFNKDGDFTFCLRDAFGQFINDRQVAKAWGTDTSKVGEMIAKYMDLLLRGGLKAVPRSLVSDAIDRDEAEKKGQSSTGKDVFEAFYKRDLARRLLMARSASQDAERNMLAKLRGECGSTFTHRLETMFKDQELSRDEMISYKQSLSNTSKTTLDLQVSVLSSAAWPTYPDIQVNLPAEVARHIEKYDRHYKHKHGGRRLTWKHSLAHSVVKATFNKGVKELLVSGFQAIVLVIFNDLEHDGHLSYTDISKATGLVDGELERTLQSLACAKIRILTKHPKGRDISHTDTFTINLNFSDPRYRIKINQIQMKETKAENKEMHEKVARDRSFETQAAIVRIMKSRKTLTHQNLVAEVINSMKGRGAVEPAEIKKHIEKLLEKDYMEREESGAYSKQPHEISKITEHLQIVPPFAPPIDTPTMFLQRSAIAAARRAAVSPVVRRSFTSSVIRREAAPPAGSSERKIKKFEEIKTEADLFGPRCRPGNDPDRSRSSDWSRAS
ncbi:hypothetical protein EYC84_008142 [Monilinia fructicola]|uniref:Cullin family profile domain-containing protein n=1 Tax=Monilinia fructicola TaxID=38448 RepID=A0A5M9JI68_MONFR|nr:hypothetical protein EYC84_008142 [Monilinia fructicola]